MKKRPLFIIAFLVILLVVGIAYLMHLDDINNNGRLYSSKSSLCTEFAQSYLRTIPKTENDFNENKRAMAVDVETELYNICLLDLNKKALRDFRAKALEKYRY